MSLAESVLDIAAEMEKEAEEMSVQGHPAIRSLRDFARQLRLVVKASGNNPNPAPSMPTTPLDHRIYIEREKEKMRAEKQESSQDASLFTQVMSDRGDNEQKILNSVAQTEEGVSGRQVEAEGGPLDKTLVPIAATMPPGARTIFSGAVYRLSSQGRLTYCPEDTARLKKG